MKRSYAQTLRSGTAMIGPNGPLSDADARLARAEALLREANRDRIAEHDQTRSKREAIMVNAAREEARKQGASHSIHNVFVREDTDGTLKFETVVYKAVSKEVADLMDNPQSLLTGLAWDGLGSPDRVAMLKQLALSPDLVFAQTVLEVLPEKSKTYVLAWQKQINNGAAWTGSLSVGARADELIDQGYLLHGREPHSSELTDLPARDTIQGRPGSPNFVRAIMGQAYLDWLLAGEEHPIEA